MGLADRIFLEDSGTVCPPEALILVSVLYFEVEHAHLLFFAYLF